MISNVRWNIEHSPQARLSYMKPWSVDGMMHVMQKLNKVNVKRWKYWRWKTSDNTSTCIITHTHLFAQLPLTIQQRGTLEHPFIFLQPNGPPSPRVCSVGLKNKSKYCSDWLSWEKNTVLSENTVQPNSARVSVCPSPSPAFQPAERVAMQVTEEEV